MRLRPAPKTLTVILVAPLLLFTGCSGTGKVPKERVKLVVGAAASTARVAPDLLERYEKENPGVAIETNFAASGALLQQASLGARMDLFLFADRATVKGAEEQGINFMIVSTVATNSLALVLPGEADHGWAGFEFLKGENIRRVCIGDPSYVPLGRYSKKTLERAGFWEELAPKLLLAGSASQARQYVASGEVDAAILYATDAALLAEKAGAVSLIPGVVVEYVVAVPSETEHAEAARRLAAWLASDSAESIFRQYGFGRGMGE